LPSDDDMIPTGANIRISNVRCRQIIDEVREITKELEHFF
jgi:hypothetical protein